VNRPYTLSDFDFALPPELIARQPTPERSASRLLDATADVPADRQFRELPALLRSGDLLVFNDTRVIKARLLGAKLRADGSRGGVVEALVERVLADDIVLAQLRASKAPKPGGRLRFPAEPHALLERHGHVPLPPYIARADDAEDERRYQTVFAARPGAVAAPTAALHFDAAVLEALQARGIELVRVTLHVGAGTFQPVRSENLAEHVMHSEWFEVSDATAEAIRRTRAAGGRIVAVGTTTLRALESAAQGAGDALLQSGSRETGIFITPGFEFRIADVLLTNFHLPRSTLLMLVSAFAGFERIRALYAHAIRERYRFFSYGDAMLLERAEPLDQV
jgi:S-adenosylmethionine:tRNA ribosyltransferase-isomerase